MTKKLADAQKNPTARNSALKEATCIPSFSAAVPGKTNSTFSESSGNVNLKGAIPGKNYGTKIPVNVQMHPMLLQKSNGWLPKCAKKPKFVVQESGMKVHASVESILKELAVNLKNGTILNASVLKVRKETLALISLSKKHAEIAKNNKA